MNIDLQNGNKNVHASKLEFPLLGIPIDRLCVCSIPTPDPSTSLLCHLCPRKDKGGRVTTLVT